MDVLGHKQLEVTGKGWFGSAAFTGVAQVRGGPQTDQWLAELVHGLGPFGRFESLLEGLCTADEWLKRIPLKDRRLTFTVVSYHGTRPEVAVVSNFQNGRGSTYAVQDELTTYRYKPAKPQVVLTGMADAVSSSDRGLLRSLLRRKVPVQELMETLARVNARSADRTEARNTISPACLVTAVSPSGRMNSHPFGLDPGKAYMPPAQTLSLEGLNLEGLARELGIPGPLRLVESHTVTSGSAPQADADEATNFN